MASLPAENHPVSWWWSFSLGLIGGAAGLASAIAWRPDLATVLVISVTVGVVLVYCYCIGFIFQKLPFAQTDESALSGFDTWCRRRDIAWSEISHVSLLNIPLCPCLRVFAVSGGSPIWVPLILEDTGRFKDVVAAHTSPDSPLLAWLNEHAV